MLLSQEGAVDVESLERENDRSLDTLSERLGLLKQVGPIVPVLMLLLCSLYHKTASN
jgi:hypothetical protein